MWFRRRQRPPMPPAPRRAAGDRPDVEKARADLARVRSQRPDVDALVAALIIEKHLNNFSANLTATFRGGRP
jgi:hypothetical protein